MVTLLTVLLPLFTHAITMEVLDPCSGEISFRGEFKNMENMNVGQATIKAFNTWGIDYQATDNSVISIFSTPSGSDAFVILSKSEMRAYGWCYTVNGVELAVYPNEAIIHNDKDEIRWFYGYALYQDGEWKTMCEKAWQHPVEPYCFKTR